MDKSYNGWKNYATWRVNLEIFDGIDARDEFNVVTYGDEDSNLDAIYKLSKRLEQYADDVISQDGSLDGLAIDYARAFLSDVDWYEIANHMVRDDE